MKDTKNLIKKRDYEYPRMIRLAMARGDTYKVDYYERQLKLVKTIIQNRFENRRKNSKQHRKAN